jgi:predicted RNase H-like HicB family nuclease
MVQLDLKLPDSLAREAQAAGLLTPQAIEQLLREEIRRRRVGQLSEAADRQAALDVPPQTEAETEAEIQAVREAKRVYMPTYQFTVVIEPDEDRFHAYVPALPGCHTFGDTLDEARANIAEAIQLHIESMQQDGEPVPTEHEPLFVTRLSVPAAA